jgi:transcriptional regulator with XRE-family HTH domain
MDGGHVNNFAHNIIKRRTELGITQDELARMLGYKTRSSVNKIERGINDVPRWKVEEFARALQTTPAELMGWGVVREPEAVGLETETAEAGFNLEGKVVILGGLPGSGRSFLLRQIVEMHENIVMVKRYSTRRKWISEDENMETIEGSSKGEIKECDIHGIGFGVEYGCKLADIDTILSQNKTPIIVGGLALVSPLRKIYPNSLSIYLFADPTLQETAMVRQGHTREVILERAEYQKRVLFDAFHDSVYDYVLPNHYNGTTVKVLNEIILKGDPKASIKGAINVHDLRG